MNSFELGLRRAIITGAASAYTAGLPTPDSPAESAVEGSSFQQLLDENLAQKSGIVFSKHALKRVADHNIELSDANLDRLNRGVRLAETKNLDDTLILVDSAAFLVNVKSNTVITALNKAQDSVFTNIDGTVIV